MQTKSTPIPRTCATCGISFLSLPPTPTRAIRIYCSLKCCHESPRQPLADRFWSKVNKTASCWLWTGAIDWNGYGQLNIRDDCGKRTCTQATRVSWELHRGPIPAGLHVCHNCPGGDNPRCVNPDHLFLGTPKDNVADSIAKGRWFTEARFAARSVRQRGEKRPGSKLTPEVIIAIRQRAAAGELQKALALEFNVSRPLISRIVSQKKWKHVPTS